MKKTSLFHQTTQNGLLLFVLLTTANIAFSQGYQSFFGKDKTTYHIFDRVSTKGSVLGEGTTSQYEINTNDTVTICDTAYLHYYGMFLVREDTNTGKIFRRIADKEYLICDMSLNEGDTFTLPIYEPRNWYSEMGYLLIVDSVTEDNGKKVIYFAPIEDDNISTFFGYFFGVSLKFIEGIGPSYGPFGCINIFYQLPVLLCVDKEDSTSEEDTTYVLFPHLGCEQHGGGIEENKKSILQIYPNPVNTTFRVILSDLVQKIGELKIYNNFGQLLYQNLTHLSDEPVDVSHFPNGFYILKYQIKNQIYQSTFIKIQ